MLSSFVWSPPPPSPLSNKNYLLCYFASLILIKNYLHFVFLREDGRMEFSYSSTDDGDRGQVRLRKVGETAVA